MEYLPDLGALKEGDLCLALFDQIAFRFSFCYLLLGGVAYPLIASPWGMSTPNSLPYFLPSLIEPLLCVEAGHYRLSCLRPAASIRSATDHRRLVICLHRRSNANAAVNPHEVVMGEVEPDGGA